MIDSRRVSARLAKEFKSVRHKRVARLRQRILSGQYQIQASKVVKSLLFGQ